MVRQAHHERFLIYIFLSVRPELVEGYELKKLIYLKFAKKENKS